MGFFGFGGSGRLIIWIGGWTVIISHPMKSMSLNGSLTRGTCHFACLCLLLIGLDSAKWERDLWPSFYLHQIFFDIFFFQISWIFDFQLIGQNDSCAGQLPLKKCSLMLLIIIKLHNNCSVDNYEDDQHTYIMPIKVPTDRKPLPYM